MAEGTSSPYISDRQSDRQHSDEAPRAERSPGPREGGFRIRLSDNEMRSARALQEAFGLRSTVAVLGFALRTLGQQLEEGKLEELVNQHRAQAGSKGSGARSEGRRERPEGGRGSGGRWQDSAGKGGRGGPRVDPFARPSRPAAAPEPAEESPAETLIPEFETADHPVESTAQDDAPAAAADTPSPVEAADSPLPAAAADTPASAGAADAPAQAPEPDLPTVLSGVSPEAPEA